MLYTSSYGTITPEETKRLVGFVDNMVRNLAKAPSKPAPKPAKANGRGKTTSTAKTQK